MASEANEVSERQQKKVITPEHVIEALMTLGFQEYVEDVKTVHKEYKEQASVRGISLHRSFIQLTMLTAPAETSQARKEQTGQAGHPGRGAREAAAAAV